LFCITIHILDYLDPRLFGLFHLVPTSPDNQGSTVSIPSQPHTWLDLEHGHPSASPHRVNTLSSCPNPDTVGRMRSFIWAYKVLSRLFLRCSAYLAPFDNATAGRQSQEAISWTDELWSSFNKAQHTLSSSHTITLPRPEDQLWIMTNGAL